MREEGVITGDDDPTDDEVRRFDKTRKGKKVSNEEWVSPTDSEARIARMKDGTTHLAYKAEQRSSAEREIAPDQRSANVTTAPIAAPGGAKAGVSNTIGLNDVVVVNFRSPVTAAGIEPVLESVATRSASSHCLGEQQRTGANTVQRGVSECPHLTTSDIRLQTVVDAWNHLNEQVQLTILRLVESESTA